MRGLECGGFLSNVTDQPRRQWGKGDFSMGHLFPSQLSLHWIGSPSLLPHPIFSSSTYSFFPPKPFLFSNFIALSTYVSLQVKELLNPDGEKKVCVWWWRGRGLPQVLCLIHTVSLLCCLSRLPGHLFWCGRQLHLFVASASPTLNEGEIDITIPMFCI